MKKLFKFMCGLASSFAFVAAITALNSACFTTYYQPLTSSDLDVYRK